MIRVNVSLFINNVLITDLQRVVIALYCAIARVYGLRVHLPFH